MTYYNCIIPHSLWLNFVWTLNAIHREQVFVHIGATNAEMLGHNVRLWFDNEANLLEFKLRYL